MECKPSDMNAEPCGLDFISCDMDPISSDMQLIPHDMKGKADDIGFISDYYSKNGRANFLSSARHKMFALVCTQTFCRLQDTKTFALST